MRWRRAMVEKWVLGSVGRARIDLPALAGAGGRRTAPVYGSVSLGDRRRLEETLERWRATSKEGLPPDKLKMRRAMTTRCWSGAHPFPRSAVCRCKFLYRLDDRARLRALDGLSARIHRTARWPGTISLTYASFSGTSGRRSASTRACGRWAMSRRPPANRRRGGLLKHQRARSGGHERRAGARSREGLRRAGVVRRDARKRHRPGAQHPPVDPPNFTSRVTFLRPAAILPETSCARRWKSADWADAGAARNRDRGTHRNEAALPPSRTVRRRNQAMRDAAIPASSDD